MDIRRETTTFILGYVLAANGDESVSLVEVDVSERNGETEYLRLHGR